MTSFVVVSIFFVAGCASKSTSSDQSGGGSVPRSEKLYSYDRLILKDLDQMNRLVRDKIRDSRKGGDKAGPLREAMQAVYSRPNDDFMIEKVVTPLKSELEEADGWESTMKSLVDEAVGNLRNPEGLRDEAQITYAIMLENIMAELKPDVKGPFEHGIFTQVRDSNIALTKKAQNKRALGIMRAVKSPSEMAGEVLAEYDQRQKSGKVEEESEAEKRGPLSKKKK